MVDMGLEPGPGQLSWPMLGWTLKSWCSEVLWSLPAPSPQLPRQHWGLPVCYLWPQARLLHQAWSPLRVPGLGHWNNAMASWLTTPSLPDHLPPSTHRTLLKHITIMPKRPVLIILVLYQIGCCLFPSLMRPSYLEWCLAHRRCSINIYGMTTGLFISYWIS